ncbi:MAG TPA: ABC transporter substrate-binding protein [Terracidiphilus sp.]|nr:ABC transporter substrate-binding protein [Terracidiphilus sp.]
MNGKLWWLASACAAAIMSGALVWGQAAHPCQCGAHPPGPPPDREVTPYAGTPQDLEPYERFVKPYYENYTHPNIYTGAARDIPDPKDVKEVRIGFLGPIAKQADQVYGIRMLHGAQMAIDEANARGGYGGKPFRLMVHDDYSNWQFGAEGGEQRPTDSAIWGAPIDESVKMIYDEKVWAIFGSISSESTHMVLRLVLKAETPLVNSASTDPTVPETYVPWYFTDIQDDRVQAYTLARRVFTELGLKRAALLRVNNRYGRMAAEKFRAAAVRLGRPVVIEQKYLPGDTDYTRQLRIIRDSRVDAIVLWGDEPEAAGILKQMRAMGMKQRVFGAYRTLGDDLVARAGPAAEGFEALYPYDPSRSDPRWLAFQQRYQARFGEKPEQFAALAYDAMNMLLDSICKAGLNRARIQDALDQVYQYDGVTGHMIFDPNNKNVSPMYLGTVHDGAIRYRVITMDKALPQAQAAIAPNVTPYARVGEDPVTYLGPRVPDAPAGAINIILFGPKASEMAESAAVRAALSPRNEPTLWHILPVDSNQNWGVASTQLVRGLMERHALAMVALDRNSAHLAEQLALKTFVPVVALSSDRTLTSANIPWIFRLPAATSPADALRLLRAVEATSGPNPERLRDALASGAMFAGVAFQPAGEPRGR